MVVSVKRKVEKGVIRVGVVGWVCGWSNMLLMLSLNNVLDIRIAHNSALLPFQRRHNICKPVMHTPHTTKNTKNLYLCKASRAYCAV